MTMFIYGLIDQRTRLIRYVGLATNERRPSDHLEDLRGNTHRANWLRELFASGFSYDPCILEICTSVENLLDAEIWWIFYGRLSGWPLTNVSDGGECDLSAKTRAKQAERLRERNKDRIWTDEARAAIGFSNSTREVSAETRAKMSDNMLGNKRALGFRHTEEAKQWMSFIRTGVAKKPYRCSVCGGIGHNRLTCGFQ